MTRKNINTLELVENITKIASETKAIDLKAIDLKNISSLADYLVIASARSQKQVQGIARNITDKLRKIGFKTYSIEGFTTGHWILIDYNDVIVHIFLDDIRAHYEFDELLSDYKQINVDQETGDLIL
ncbi:MAG: ribosome silencing factor [Bdellovibrionota bacterium]